MEKDYIKVTLYTTTQGVEVLSGLLQGLGVDSFSVEDPADLDCIIASKDVLKWDFIDLPDALATRETLMALYFENTNDSMEKIQEIREALRVLRSDERKGFYGADADFGRLCVEEGLISDDWRYKYKETFRTFSPCDGIIISPPWEVHDADLSESANLTAKPGETPLRIIIDPGMAFGTGSHETTSMCLEKLAAIIKPGDVMLDAGTGSGILAITAVLLGAARVDAVEIDEDAAASAAVNIAANGVADKVRMYRGDLTRQTLLPGGTRYDLIIANISSTVLRMLLPKFTGYLRDGGRMILSGVLDAQQDQVLEMLEFGGLKTVGVRQEGEWLMFEVGR